MSRIYKTYINGFDEELEGGIPEHYVVLLAGAPGTLKSTVAYNIAYKNAKNNGSKVLYMALDKGKDKFLEQMNKFGMDNAGGNVVIYDLPTIKSTLSQFKGGNWWEPFKNNLQEYKERFDFDLLVLDSLQVLELVVKFTDVKAEMYQIFEWLKDRLKVTGILISEMASDSNKLSRYDEEIIADGIIHLSMLDAEHGVERRIRCVKMSGVGHNTNYFRLHLRDKELYAEKLAGKKAAPGAFVAPAAGTGSDSYSF